jgi:hypothetical protein
VIMIQECMIVFAIMMGMFGIKGGLVDIIPRPHVERLSIGKLTPTSEPGRLLRHVTTCQLAVSSMNSVA